MTTKKITPSVRTGIRPTKSGIRRINRDQMYGKLIMALNWGARSEYPEEIAADYKLWSLWLSQKSWEKTYNIRHHGSKGSKTKLLSTKRKTNVHN